MTSNDSTEGAAVIILQGLFGLGFSELVVIAVAILLILGPKNIALVKPIIKSVYKGWLQYQKEVYKAQNDMQEMRESVLEPIKEAEREAELELRQTQKEMGATTQQFGNIMGRQQAPKMAGMRQRRFQGAQQMGKAQPVMGAQKPQAASMQRQAPAKPQMQQQPQAQIEAPKPAPKAAKAPEPAAPKPKKAEKKAKKGKKRGSA